MIRELRYGFITSLNPIIMDTENHLLRFQRNSSLVYGNAYQVDLSNTEYDTTDWEVGKFLMFDINDRAFIPMLNKNKNPQHVQVFIGVNWAPNNITLFGNPPISKLNHFALDGFQSLLNHNLLRESVGFINTSVIMWNSTTKTLSFPTQTSLICKDHVTPFSQKQYVLDSLTTGAYIGYSYATHTFITSLDYDRNEDFCWVGAIWQRNGVFVPNLHTSAIVYADGVPQESIYQNNGIISSRQPCVYSTKNHTLYTGNNASILLGNRQFSINNKSIDLTQEATKGSHLFYDIDKKTISGTRNSDADKNIAIGSIWANDIPKINGISVLVNHSSVILSCIGDSITQGTGTTKIYIEWLKTALPYTQIKNYGVGGSTIAKRPNNNIVWDTAVPIVERYNNLTDIETDILIFAGVNDWVTGREIGEIDSEDQHTVYGALNIILSNLIEKHKGNKIYFFTPLQNNYKDRPPYSPQDNETGKNSKGLTIQDYTQAIKKSCAKYSVPCKDLTAEGFYGTSATYLGNNKGVSGIFGSDGLHPNAAGHEFISQIMINFINSH